MRTWVVACMVTMALVFEAQAFLPTPSSTIRLTSQAVNQALKATLVDQSEFARAELARKQKEYETELKQRMMTQAKASSTETAPVLATLPKIPYLTSEGLISDPGATPQVKASVYAVADEAGKVVYIGVSRNVAQSLRLHLARVPDQTYSYQVFHITKPSRVLLEITRDAWVEELGYTPTGNDEGALQAMWEAPMDVRPLMTEADHAAIESARERQRPEEMAIKKIARRFEDAKVKILEERGCQESMRFDPKLKGQGLLDLYMEKAKDEVPSEKPKK